MRRMTRESMHRVPGHSLVCPLTPITHSLALHCLLCTARFTRESDALILSLALTQSRAHSVPRSRTTWFCLRYERRQFQAVSTHRGPHGYCEFPRASAALILSLALTQS